MANELQSGAAAPAGLQNIVITQGTDLVTTIEAPTSSGKIWFSFSIGSGAMYLLVNFNGQSYENVPPGQYQLKALTTPLELIVQGTGNAKLTWIAD